jgi:hypothetical protein
MDFRKKEQLELFEVVLDNLLDFIEGDDLLKFKEVFESLPPEIYDKIIDLEDLSFKTRDSKRFHTILNKSKQIAKTYNKLFK